MTLTSCGDKELVQLVGEDRIGELSQVKLECSGKCIVVPVKVQYVHLGRVCVEKGVGQLREYASKVSTCDIINIIIINFNNF